MLSKFRILKNLVAPHPLSLKITTFKFNASHCFLSINPLCTFPASVNFSDNPTSPPNSNSENDDFVVPSLAPWIDAHLLSSKHNLAKHTSHENNIEDVEAITSVLKQRYSSPELVSQALDGCGFQLSHALVEQILKRFNNDWVSAFGFFKWAKTQTGYLHSPKLYDLMVDILGKSKNFDLMWELVDEMAKLEGYVNFTTMSKVIRRLASAKKYQEAIEAYRRMGAFGFEKDTAALNVLMEALSQRGSFEDALNVFLEFKSLVPLNSRSFNILIHGWCQVRNFDKARKVMEEMKEHGFEPDVFTYSPFIEAYCRGKDFETAEQVLEEMRKNGCPPNACSYGILMLALGKTRKIKEALEVYEKMKSDGCVPDTPFYSSLIFVLGKDEDGRLKDAYDLFNDMAKQGVVRDVLTYNTMISTACAHGQEETALRLLKEMEEKSCKPNLETYHPLLRMCCRKKRMKVLKFLLDHMLKNDLSPDLGTYSLLINGLCRSGQLEHACLFFEEMVLQGLTPRPDTLKLLVGMLELKSMLNEKKRVENLIARVIMR